MSHSKRCSRCSSKPCCCPLENENENKVNNQPIFNFNPIINMPSTPVNGGLGLLSEFDGSVLAPPISIPNPGPTPNALLGTATLSINNSTDRVLIQANIPWQFTQTPPVSGPIELAVLFRILRNNSDIIYVS